MLTCRELVHQQASDYLDRQLTLRQRAGVWFHLALCENCRRFMRQLRLLRRVLGMHTRPVDETTVRAVAERLHHAHTHREK